MTAVARVADLAKTHPGGVVALEGVSLELERGSITALVGPNGAGKTTFARILTGEVAPSAGSARVFGEDPLGAPRALRMRLAYLAQDVELDPELTGRETLALFGALHGLSRRRTRERLAALSTEFGLDAHLDKRVEAYSGGLKRRLHVGLAFLHEPELSILDEPTAGLDRDGRELLWTRVAGAARGGGTALVLTHDLADVERHCQRLVVMAHGRVVADDTPEALVREHARRRVDVALGRGVDPAPVVTALRGIDGAGAVTASGVVVGVELAGASIDRVLFAVEQSGVQVREIKLREPDLDTAYASLVGVVEPVERGARRRRGRA